MAPPISAFTQHPIAQVVHFSEIDGMLVDDWPIADSGPVAGRVPLTDLPGDSIVQCRWSPRQRGLIYSTFEYYDMSQSGPILRHLQVLNSPQRLQLALDTVTIDTVETDSTISLIETLDHTDSEPITLRVQMLRDGKQMVNLALSAPTLTGLAAQHPSEFEKYFRPLLHEFHQDQAVFEVEDKVAWQVMADDWQPPPGVPSRSNP